MSVRAETQESRAQKVARLVRAFAADPVTVSRALPGEFWQRHGSVKYSPAQLDERWFEHLHAMFGAAWPCPEADRLDVLMEDISGRLAAQGLGSGRGTYGWYSDAEILLCRAMWCTAIHTQPKVVIETGVAHGVSSRVVLEALRLNGHGHLWSVDLAHPLDHRLHATTGVAVTDECRDRWTYLEGTSRQRLPALVADVGQVDLFIHDSLHTAKNTLFEMEQVASVLSPSGIMLVDDIKSHTGFAAFARRHSDYQTMVCESLDEIGMFGIAVKQSRGSG
jgi:predicted O-methyltransferase YrrM